MIVSAVVPAGGRGVRLKLKTPKPFIEVSGKPLLVLTLERLARTYRFEEIVVPVEPFRAREVERLLSKYGLGNVRVVAGGRTRAESVRNGVLALNQKSEWVLIHDAARPLVTPGLVRRILSEARKTGGAICALQATATVKRVSRDLSISGTEARETLYLAQTPQVFKAKDLLWRYEALGATALDRTDEAALFDGTSVRIRVVSGEAQNIKITTSEDLVFLDALLGHESGRK